MSHPSSPPPRRFGQLLRCSNKDALEQREQDTIALLMEKHDHHIVPKARPYEITTAAVGSEGIAMWEIAQQIRVLAEQLEAQRHQPHAQPLLDQTLRDVHKSLAAYTTTTTLSNQQNGSLQSVESAPLRNVLPADHQPTGSHGSVKSHGSNSKRRGAEKAAVPLAEPKVPKKKEHVSIAPPPTSLKVTTARRATRGSPRNSTQHAEKTPRHSNVTHHHQGPTAHTTVAPVTSVPLPPLVSSMRQRPTTPHHPPSTTEVILTATTTVTPPTIEVIMSSHKSRTLSDVEASLLLLEKTIQKQKQPAPTTVQARSATAGGRRSETPGRPRSRPRQSEIVDASLQECRRGDPILKEPTRRRMSTPGRVRGHHDTNTANKGSTLSQEKQHSNQSAATAPEQMLLSPPISQSAKTVNDQLNHNEEVLTTSTKRPGFRSQSAGRHRLVRVIASAGPTRSTSVGRSQNREPYSPHTSASHNIEFIAFENAKRVNTMTARDDSVGLQLQRRRATDKDEEYSQDRRLPATRPVAAENHSSTSQCRRNPAESPKTLWDRIVGHSIGTQQLEDIRHLDEIVMSTMMSSEPSPIPLLSTSSSSTYRGLVPNTRGTTGMVSRNASAASNAENRPFGEAHPHVTNSKDTASSGTSPVRRKKVTGILSEKNDGPQQQTIKYRSMMSDFEKGIEIFPQDKITTTNPDTEPCISEMSSSLSQYDPDVLRHRASMSEQLRRQQRQIEKLQRELDHSHRQRRAVVPPLPASSNEEAADMVRSRGLDERRRTQAMLEMLDAYTSLWNSNGECESEDSVLRNSPIRQRSASSKRSQSAKFIIRE